MLECVQGHIKPAQAWARDPRLLTAGSHDDVAFCDQTLPACWSDLGKHPQLV